MSGKLKDNIFEVSCRNCRHMGDAKDFIIAAGTWGVEYGTVYKDVTLKCPACQSTEIIDKTGR